MIHRVAVRNSVHIFTKVAVNPEPYRASYQFMVSISELMGIKEDKKCSELSNKGAFHVLVDLLLLRSFVLDVGCEAGSNLRGV